MKTLFTTLLLFPLLACGQSSITQSTPQSWQVIPAGYILYGNSAHTNSLYFDPFGLVQSNASGSLTISGGTITTSGSDTNEIIRHGTNTLLNVFTHPTGLSAVPNGKNTFIGVGAGNTNYGADAVSSPQGSWSTAAGYHALNGLHLGYENTAMGYSAGQYIYDGSDNSCFGGSAGFSLIDGNANTLIGRRAGWSLTNGSVNVIIGRDAGHNVWNGNRNVAIGGDAGCFIHNGNSNTFIGEHCMWNVTGDFSIGLGASAGWYETNSCRVYIDALTRNDYEDGRKKAWLYGIMDPAVENQVIRANGQLQIPTLATVPPAPDAGHVTLYAVTNLSGKIVVSAKFSDGSTNAFATQP